MKDELNIVDGEGVATIFNTLGQLVKQFSINNSQLTIDVSDLPKGQYILQVQRVDGRMITKQFIK